jgi:hypothetical protein
MRQTMAFHRTVDESSWLASENDKARFDAKTGKASVNMGALKGKISYRDWFRKNFPALFQQSLFAGA